MAKRKKPRQRRPGRSSTGRPARRPATDRRPPAEEAAPVTIADERGAREVVIVAVGASAGGLEAFSQLLQALPPEPGFAIVLVQHLAPQHESALPTLLSGRTSMPVVQAQEGMPVEPNHVYVIPPNVQMGLRDGHLHLVPRPTDRTQYTPIDFFFRSVADTLQERAIAVILSGTASDGTGGIRDVKAVGGIAIAQRPDTAKYDGMPRAAIATGLVDLVLSPAEIAEELVRISAHPLRRVRAITPRPPGDDIAPPSEEHLEEVFALLRTATGVDFGRYKRPTIQRRLQRRMVLHKLTKIDQYLKLLHETPEEVQALYRDVLIHVTRFFREPESFAAISGSILPKVVESRQEEQAIRIWVPGCSTGEEAYSVAIVVLEFLAEKNLVVPVQVFATDVSESAIEYARAGTYREGIAADVSAGRLGRFFTRVDGGYRITKAVRDVCIFARQDLTRDPPFSKLDMILCRNVLIYMGPELQKRLMNVFHYALKLGGYLVLGAAETIGLHSDLFGVADKKYRIYQKKAAAAADFALPFEQTVATPLHARRGGVAAVTRDDAKGIQGEANRFVQERYAPPGVIVDHNLQIVQFRGQTGTYLAPAPGDPSMSVLKMAREGLLHALRAVLQEARRTRAPARRHGIRVRANGGWRETAIEVVPLGGDRPHFLVLFEEQMTAARTRPVREREPAIRVPPGRVNQQVAGLQQELASSREYLQSIIQELEAANEELQSANEEVLSANEELQSTNEELDTAKEELQSTNEELNTVNEELHGRNEELARLNSDLLNLLGSVNIALVIVANDLRIRRFTPMAERVLNLLPADLGRPIGHIKPNIDCPDLEELTLRVIDTVTPTEREVHDSQGHAYSLRIRPYKNTENRIEGAVLALFEVAPYDERLVRRVRESVAATAALVKQPLAVLDDALHVHWANQRFRQLLGLPLERRIEGHALEALANGRWDARVLRERLEQMLRDEAPLDGFDLAAEAADGGSRNLVLSGRRIAAAAGGAVIVLAIDDGGSEPRPAGKEGR